MQAVFHCLLRAINVQKLVFDLTTGLQVLVDLTESDIEQLPSTTEKLSIELKALSDKYQNDLNQYRMLWTSIGITDGVNEETRKANLRTQWNTRTTQYSTDVAATKLKYQ